MGRFANDYPADWQAIAELVKREAGGRCVRCDHEHDIAAGYMLTVHHFDGNKANGSRWNLMALCQRCHLSIQARVDPRNPIFFDPSIWAMPYIAGVYAAGICTAPAAYDLARWISEYEASGRTWPKWAERPKVEA